ncbi:MAG: hypothetical protein H7Z13_20280 [Ferruginibacter sp.]|nr:hypothetical protein [Ferruginibacter sp.]
MVKLFGDTIAETKRILEASVHAGGEQVTKEDKNKVIGRIIVTCLMIFLAAYLFTSGSKEIGGTIVGAVVGYWMK